jgi:hypothetical protein
MTIELAKNMGCKKCVHYKRQTTFHCRWVYLVSLLLQIHRCSKNTNCITDAIHGPLTYYGDCTIINKNLDCLDWIQKPPDPPKRPWWKRLFEIE